MRGSDAPIDAVRRRPVPWYLRRTRRRMSRNDDAADRDAAFATLHRRSCRSARVLAPILPFLAEEMYQVLVATRSSRRRPESVHLTRWPDAELAPRRDERLERRWPTLRRAVDLARTLREQAGIRVRQPLARLWLALPGGRLGGGWTLPTSGRCSRCWPTRSTSGRSS